MGCEPESYGDSPIPSIELVGFEVLQNELGLDSIIEVVLDYSEGDGNIGLSDEDTNFPFAFGDPHFNNLKVDLERDSLGVWVGTSDDSLQLSQRIVDLEPDGDVKSIRGSINLKLPVKPTLLFAEKRVRYFFTLEDRDLQQSNRVGSGTVNLNY